MMHAMDELKIGDQVIRYDRELTRQAYSLIESGGAEECGCSYCRNFVEQRSIAYPEHFRSLLDQLGIDSNKEGEVYELGPSEGLRLYGGWLFLAGELVEAGEQLTTEAGSGFQYHFTEANRLPKPAANFGDQVLAIDFRTTLPWVVEGEP
jgi:hypothetical protein